MAPVPTAPLRPLIVIGTRPEAIKLALLCRAFREQPGRFAPLVCFTGQHRELLDQAAAYFKIRADIDLNLMTPDQSLAQFSARSLEALDGVLAERRPDCVVGQGDTTTALSAATAAFYRRIPFVHVEAGLRTGDRWSPWPEEFNRRAISLTAALHCAPTERAASNLRAEGIAADSIHVTGNTVVDALRWAVERERANSDHARRFADCLGGPLVLVTCHRRESFGPPLRAVCQALAALAARWSQATFVLPVHRNPAVEGTVREMLSGRSNIRLLPPLDYPAFIWLLDRAALVLTDSGGVQEEAASLGKPLLVLRDETERVEAVEAGLAELVGTSSERIVSRASAWLSGEARHADGCHFQLYGDGQAAGRIVELIQVRYGR
jgi:UDP-N-acetylglucosamine 2-epimerase (non-hydrolysing)